MIMISKKKEERRKRGTVSNKLIPISMLGIEITSQSNYHILEIEDDIVLRSVNGLHYCLIKL
jgi:hypothetical protein